MLPRSLSGLVLLTAAVQLLSAAPAVAARPRGDCEARGRRGPEQTVRARSPDGRVELVVSFGAQIFYTVCMDNREMIGRSLLGLRTAEAGELAANPVVTGVRTTKVERVVQPPNPLWNSSIRDRYRLLELRLRSGLVLNARVADDGVALRLGTELAGPQTVTRESFGYRLDPAAEVSAPLVDCPTDPSAPDCFHSDFERLYPTMAAGAIPPGRLSQLPVVVHSRNGWLALSEAAVFRYPGAWLRAVAPGGFELALAGAPKATGSAVNDHWKYESVTERQTWLARFAQGPLRLPWRVIQLGRTEGELVGRDFLSRLTDACPEGMPRAPGAGDWSWVRPGFGTDEWIISSQLGLDPAAVGFVPGLNTATYRYYVDFAAREGFPYIIVDDGWADPNDLSRLNPEIDLPEVIRYGRLRGVKIMLWAQSWTVRQDVRRTLDLFAELGVAGIEMDFNQRDDVDMQLFEEKVVREAAARRLLVSLHGTGKPTGLHLCYPNLITVESGRGHEYNRGGTTVTPRHKLDIAFIRALQGPFDYEGGSMNNVQPEHATGQVPHVEAQGTRVNELAVSLVYPSAFQVIAGDLAAYEKDPEMMAYYKGLPTTWDETRVLEAEFGKLLVLARRKGDAWFFAGMSAGETAREVTLDLSFLPERLRLRELRDGPRADESPQDYVASTGAPRHVGAKRLLRVRFSRNGGWVARTL